MADCTAAKAAPAAWLTAVLDIRLPHAGSGFVTRGVVGEPPSPPRGPTVDETAYPAEPSGRAG